MTFQLRDTTTVERMFPKKNTDLMLKHLFDGTDWNVYDNKVMNLGVGAPGPDILTKCCDIFDEATRHRMQKEIENRGILFQYGPTTGVLEARVEIAKFLTDAYHSEVKSEDIIITTGASHGLHIILSTLVDLRGFVFVDEVTYMIVLGSFQQFTGLTIVPVKLNNDGVDIDHLTDILEQKTFVSQTKQFWGMYYAIPTFHNPTGITFTEDVSKRLIAVARKYDILIACDDVYNTLTYVGEPPNRLFKFDNPNDEDFKGNVISNGSFSKIIAPGLRLGWMEAHPRCKKTIEDSSFLLSGGGLNNYTSGIMAALFELGLAQSHYAFAKDLYSKRMLSCIDTLNENLHRSCSFFQPKGGYFIWIKMPKEADSNELLDHCIKKYKVSFITGNTFSINNDFKHCFRIAIAFQEESTLIDACRKICKAIDEYLENKIKT